MTIAEMLPLMSDAEIRKNAHRGGVAAIAELKRRTTQQHEAAAAIRHTRRNEPGIFNTQAEILGDQHNRFADRIAPDPNSI